MKMCQCGRQAAVYAMDPAPNGWGDYYCWVCVNAKWIIEELYREDGAE